MNKPKNKGMLISSLFMIALIVVTFSIVFKDNSLAETFALVKEVNPLFLIGAFLMLSGYVIFQALAFQIPMNRLGTKIKFFDHVCFAFVGFYFSGITPSSTGGQPMQLYYMKRNGVSTADATLTLLISNTAYQMVLMLYGIIMLVLRWSFVSEAVLGMKALIMYGYTLASLLLIGLFFVMYSKKFATRAVRFFINLFSKIRLIKNKEKALASAEEQVSDYTSGAEVIRKDPALFYKVFGVSILQMTCYFLIPFFIYKAFGLAGANVLDLLAIQAILFMAVAFLPLPGAVGATEQAFVLLFSAFFGEALVVPGMLLSRGISFYFLMLLSGGVVLYMQLRKPKELIVHELPQIETKKVSAGSDGR